MNFDIPNSFSLGTLSDLAKTINFMIKLNLSL